MSAKTQTVDDYIAKRPEPVSDLLKRLRAFVNETLAEASEGMKWGAPVFFNAKDHPVIYLYGGRDHANLGFIRGAELKDPERILEGKGKQGRHVKIFPGKPIPKGVLKALIKQCATE